MSTLDLDVHGVRARVSCKEDPVLDGLRRDFAYFAAAPSAGPALRLDLEVRSPASGEVSGGIELFRGLGFRVRSRGGERIIRYADGALAVYDFRARRGRIICPDPERLHELAYLALLSRTGEELDRQGLHRVHALGFEWNGQGGLILLPSGGGKSSLALEMLRLPGMGLISEDTPLVDARGRLRAFPLRMGFRPGTDLSGVPPEFQRVFHRKRHGPKVLVDLDFFRHRVRAEAPVRWLLVGRPGGKAAAFEPVSRGRAAAALAAGLVVGHGVAQMAEYMLRPSPSGLWRLARIAAARARAAAALLRTAYPWRFTLGGDPRAGARELAAFLSRS